MYLLRLSSRQNQCRCLSRSFLQSWCQRQPCLEEVVEIKLDLFRSCTLQSVSSVGETCLRESSIRRSMSLPIEYYFSMASTISDL